MKASKVGPKPETRKIVAVITQNGEMILAATNFGELKRVLVRTDGKVEKRYGGKPLAEETGEGWTYVYEGDKIEVQF